ncbi:potassium-transporting ATPase subunit KdpC [uncultured Oxalicibacterium sp.]|uniref:potassium-transporting ATPase subunit KdpC n=1 Tax=uncultured Oxalicibacterium sp. TaxID=1168540 RepID=UPI0025F40D18|nr:potassium-transporting ATPase subunit KdpC [uncultured Oxalicibacterium sp.]
MKSLFRPALVLFAALTLVCCLFYPYAVTGIARLAFPQEAAGSLIAHQGKLVGSSLIGQAFSSPRYFWGRPSATSPMPNNGASSSGSNLGPSNQALIEVVSARVNALQHADPDNKAAIPVDLVTASASGLDPEISLAAAYYQVARIARARDLSESQVKAVIDRLQQLPLFGLFGEPRVNVLALNLVLDAQH